MRSVWTIEQTLNRNANILLIITSIFLLIFSVLFLLLPTTKKRMVYGVMSEKNHLQTYLTKEELNTIQTWNCGHTLCQVTYISSKELEREDGQSMYLVTLKVNLEKERNRKGNYILYEMTKKQSKYQQLQDWIRSVIS